MSGGPKYKPTPPRNSCSLIRFEAAVNSPKGTVINQLQVGTVLDVRLDNDEQTVVVEYIRQLVGSLTGSQTVQLIGCIKSGFEYKAIVTKLDGGLCVVRVEAR